MKKRIRGDSKSLGPRKMDCVSLVRENIQHQHFIDCYTALSPPITP